jgi:hypothetical protein
MIEVTGAVGMMPISEGWRRRDGGETEEGNLCSSQLSCPTSPPPPRAGRRRLHVGEGRCCKGHHARRHLYTRLLVPNPSLSIVERESIRECCGWRPFYGPSIFGGPNLIVEN